MLTTCDILVPNQARYQLRYIPMNIDFYFFVAFRPIADEMSKTTATHSAQNNGFSKMAVREIKIAVGPSAPPITPMLAD